MFFRLITEIIRAQFAATSDNRQHSFASAFALDLETDIQVFLGTSSNTSK